MLVEIPKFEISIKKSSDYQELIALTSLQKYKLVAASKVWRTEFSDITAANKKLFSQRRRAVFTNEVFSDEHRLKDCLSRDLSHIRNW